MEAEDKHTSGYRLLQRLDWTIALSSHSVSHKDYSSLGSQSDRKGFQTRCKKKKDHQTHINMLTLESHIIGYQYVCLLMVRCNELRTSSVILRSQAHLVSKWFLTREWAESTLQKLKWTQVLQPKRHPEWLPMRKLLHVHLSVATNVFASMYIHRVYVLEVG